jgi:hypothetical protein
MWYDLVPWTFNTGSELPVQRVVGTCCYSCVLLLPACGDPQWHPACDGPQLKMI